MFVQSFFCVTLRCYQYYKTAIMGFIRKYKCVACGYEADIYEGKGFMGQTIEMVSCADCHSVQPLVVGGVIRRCCPFVSHIGRQTVLELRFRTHHKVGRAYLSAMQGQYGRYGQP